jgi:biotin transport system substrate-specific component
VTTVSLNARPTVLADALIRNRSLATDAALIVAGTALVSALAQVAIPLWPVPITGQTLGVVIVGAALGSRRGALSLALYLVAGVAGLPIFTGFAGGVSSIHTPSFGFIIGFVFSAFAVGWLAERRWDRRFWLALAGFAIASVVPFLIGVPWLAVSLGASGYPNDPATVLSEGVYPFLIGGVVKAAIAAAVVPLAWRGVRAADKASGRSTGKE